MLAAIYVCGLFRAISKPLSSVEVHKGVHILCDVKFKHVAFGICALLIYSRIDDTRPMNVRKKYLGLRLAMGTVGFGLWEMAS